MTEEYWSDFWRDQGRKSRGETAQQRVLRTTNRTTVSEDVWLRTVEHVCEQMDLSAGDRVLDVCAGNGLFSAEFADRGAEVLAVDVSQDLLDDVPLTEDGSIHTLCSDMRALEFPKDRFTHIFFYAAIQYLTQGEAAQLLRRCYDWLTPGGTLLIGDIPDLDRFWSFYNTPERRALYFAGLEEGRDVIGTWYDRHWYAYLGEEIGFETTKVMDQPDYQIYAHFRFDVVMRK
ncbi:MAG: methyltransferase domain-containing protein [Pseudomonadota bacterium]